MGVFWLSTSVKLLPTPRIIGLLGGFEPVGSGSACWCAPQEIAPWVGISHGPFWGLAKVKGWGVIFFVCSKFLKFLLPWLSPRKSRTWLVEVLYLIPSLKQTTRAWKLMVGRWSFPFRMAGWPIFRAMLVFRSSKTLFGWAIWNSRFYICDLPTKSLAKKSSLILWALLRGWYPPEN